MKSKRILFGVLGKVPNVITEALWYFKTQVDPKPIEFDKIVLVTTLAGRDILQFGDPEKGIQPFVHTGGVFEAFCRDFNLSTTLNDEEIFVIKDDAGNDLYDLRNNNDFKNAANSISGVLKILTEDPETEIYCIFSGGRRVMAVYLALTLSIFGRKQDHFYYPRIFPETAMAPNFYYPKQKQTEVELVFEEIPFARLGEKYRNIINSGTYGDLVRDCQNLTDWSKAPFSISKGKDVDVITKNVNFLELLSKIKRVAENGTADTYFLYGESGCGKEIVADYIHNLSVASGRKGDIVRVNCADFQTTLIESELFGYKKGAHNTAFKDNPGLLSRAAGGTLFLDEINSTDITFQAKLLRFLENRTYRMIGGTEDIPINVVVIFATNEKPIDLIKEKRMRNDFYQRISIFGYTIPPLRERPEDYELLAHYFLEKFKKEYNRPNLESISNNVLQSLKSQKFINSNVRGLRDKIRRMVVYSHADQRLLDSLPEDSDEDWGQAEEEPQKVSLPADFFSFNFEEFQKVYFQEQLKVHSGNVTKTAEAVGLKRNTLNSKLQDLGIDPNMYKIK